MEIDGADETLFRVEMGRRAATRGHRRVTLVMPYKQSSFMASMAVVRYIPCPAQN